MKVFHPNLPPIDYDEDALYRDAIYYGRQLVLDDLAQNPEREMKHYEVVPPSWTVWRLS